MTYLIENNNKPKNVTEIHYLQKMCEKPTSKEVGDSEKKSWKINIT